MRERGRPSAEAATLPSRVSFLSPSLSAASLSAADLSASLPRLPLAAFLPGDDCPSSFSASSVHLLSGEDAKGDISEASRQQVTRFLDASIASMCALLNFRFAVFWSYVRHSAALRVYLHSFLANAARPHDLPAPHSVSCLSETLGRELSGEEQKREASDYAEKVSTLKL
ncbi:hypothetical protein TGVEG_306440A [Toxoplasma gondii VEG]|uniref:Uncharacterized protein n=5 Tax=Toxoplasma gondii TaxID=5811 RepID=V4Z943_TOXGV|nr:hypothetical protein TGVEG_306440A [Toxoplasma gondii VEG]